MTTTFPDPETIRDGIVSLLTTASAGNAGWANVYGYMPGVSEIVGRTPVCIVRRRGTTQDMMGLYNNPTEFRFMVTSMVLGEDSAAGWTSANAEDKLDELDQLYRQTIRDNANGSTYCDLFRFGGQSAVDDVIIEGLPYIVETHELFAVLNTGAAP